MKKEVRLGCEGDLMTITDWKTGKVIWRVIIGGAIRHCDALRMAYRDMAARGWFDPADADPN